MNWISYMNTAVVNISSSLYKKFKENGTQNMGNLLLEITAVSMKFHQKVNLYKISRKYGKSVRCNAIRNAAFYLVI